MRVVDDAVLERFRHGPCEWCHAVGPTHPHHVFARGHGGGRQIDHEWNVVALCPLCHRAHHDGHDPTKTQLLVIVSAREGVEVEDIEVFIYRVRRMDRDAAATAEAADRIGQSDADDPAGREIDLLLRPLAGTPPGRPEGLAAHEDDGGWVGF